ncbi:MAG: metalloregulator ArsR/SmtB family transcription factor [Micromonosporaceae bacterium]|nr:metalloregulator ArsR/SmtB family transcription factor [Micromonosporaceae bacterium]
MAQVAGLACCAPLTARALDEAQAADVAKAFKALGDPVRLRLLSLITSAQGEICVCDLTGGFEVSGPTISHHLKILREAGLVDCERRGTWVYYWAKPERLQWMSTLLATPGLDPDASDASGVPDVSGVLVPAGAGDRGSPS